MVKQNKRIKLALIGLSEGNGHPYSFGAIINGYDKKAMADSKWEVIFDYLLKCDEEDFLNSQAYITHCYTQDKSISENLAKSVKIPHIIENLDDLLAADIDGVIIARDDYQTHLEIAKPFLQRDKFVFIDKPLSLESSDIAFFTPFMQSKKLASCSGLFYARELDVLRRNVSCYGEQILDIQGSIGSVWERYFIHLLDAIAGLGPFCATHIKAISLENAVSALIQTQSFPIHLYNHPDATCSLKVKTNKASYDISISDNFSAFRRLMGHFVAFMQGRYSFDYKSTLQNMRILQTIKQELDSSALVSGGGQLSVLLSNDSAILNNHFVILSANFVILSDSEVSTPLRHNKQSEVSTQKFLIQNKFSLDSTSQRIESTLKTTLDSTPHLECAKSILAVA